MSDLNLKEIRGFFNISREKMAEIIGISLSTLDTWEYRTKKIPKNKIGRVKHVFSLYFMSEDKSLRILNEPSENYKTANNFTPEGKIINDEELPTKEVTIIPVKGRGGLENSYFDDMAFKQLDTEKLVLKKPSSKGSKWFKIEIEGVSMDDSTAEFEGSKYSLVEGDWAYCRSIPRIHWKNKLHFKSVKVFCFFHNTRGIIFKKVTKHNAETGELILHSLNKDKGRFPDFKINVAECSYICNVIKVISEF